MPELVPVDHDPFASASPVRFIPVDHNPFDAPSAAQQWQSAIAANAQRQAQAPSMGQQIMDIAGNTGSILVAPLMAGPRLMGDVMEGRLDPNSPEAIRRSADVALNTAGMGMLGAERGALGIFGGQLAKTADLDALARAQKMAEAGSHPNDIWNQTGWFQGTDKKWRFEIPDQTSRIGTAALQDFSKPEGVAEGKAAGVLWHPDLYKAYPNLRKYDVTAANSEGNSGYFAQPENQMYAEGPTPDAARNTLLHEMQHAVQHEEGFPRGGNPRDPEFQGISQGIAQRASNTFAALQNEMRTWQSDWIAKQGIQPSDMDYTKWAAMGAREWKKQFPKKAAAMDTAFNDMEVRGGYPVYKRLTGEVEARNVSARMNMTPEERQAKPPWTTEDVPRSQQIVRGAPGGPQMSAPQAIVQKRGENNFLVKSPDNPDNRLAMVVEPDAVRVKTVDVRRANRNAGIGVSLYEKAIAFAAERGLPLRSDITVTNDALHVYDALRRRGYDVTEMPGTTTSAAGKSNEKHVFEVRGIPQPQRARGVSRLEPVDHDPFAGKQ